LGKIFSLTEFGGKAVNIAGVESRDTGVFVSSDGEIIPPGT
jgi:hypothetical protein